MRPIIVPDKKGLDQRLTFIFGYSLSSKFMPKPFSLNLNGPYVPKMGIRSVTGTDLDKAPLEKAPRD